MDVRSPGRMLEQLGPERPAGSGNVVVRGPAMERRDRREDVPVVVNLAKLAGSTYAPSSA